MAKSEIIVCHEGMKTCGLNDPDVIQEDCEAEGLSELDKEDGEEGVDNEEDGEKFEPIL